ncbi:MAG: hypothetical protein J1F64_09505, partial [Oscillospiraceae bacterium]|nr:hypothetical protein [Oscillospiraceae bacterium]
MKPNEIVIRISHPQRRIFHRQRIDDPIGIRLDIVLDRFIILSGFRVELLPTVGQHANNAALIGFHITHVVVDLRRLVGRGPVGQDY